MDVEKGETEELPGKTDVVKATRPDEVLRIKSWMNAGNKCMDQSVM